ncbi:MAG: glycosyltransferase family 39 protein [Anaerolineales bacterium]|nr:glycosyltransferase family 39 protein [Anaerolineales bacterium]
MNQSHTHRIVLFLFILLISIYYLSGLPSVPFHPDEQTYLFMSGDFERFVANPSQLYWDPNQSADLRQKYRLRDAPLARWLIGIGRQLARTPPPQVDWDWTKDWQTNQSNGALPSEKLLLVGRWSVAFLFPFSLWLMFQVAKSGGGNLSGWAAMILLASHALVLLHTRRAMAESGLLFSVLLTLWAIQRFADRPSWLAISAALAFNAKQSTAPLAILCFGIALVAPLKTNPNPRKQFLQAFAYGVLFVLVTLALNPVLWSNPVRAAIAAWQERTALVEEQVAAIRRVDAELVWESYPQRAFGIIAHLCFTKPATADLKNYLAETQAAEQAYFANPFHSLFRNLWGGAICFFLSLFGFAFSSLQARYLPFTQKRIVWLMILATVLQAIGQMIFIPIPFQRYVIPLIPFQCLWAAKGLEGLVQMIRNIIQKFTQPISSP